MNITFSLKDLNRLVLAVMLLAEASLPQPSRATDNTFSTKADGLLAEFRARINGLDRAHKDELQLRINEIQAKAGPLDQLQSQVEKEQGEVNTLDMDYKNAQANADSLGSKYASAEQIAHSKIKSILQEAQDLCGKLGGAMQGGMCIFTCPQDNMAPCQAKVAAGNQQIASLTSQAKSIAQQLQSEEQTADNAQKDADAKKQEWEQEKTQLAGDEHELTRKKAEFEQKVNDFRNELSAAPPAGISFKKGRAWQDLVNVDSNRRCYDIGCAPAIEPPTAPIPDAVASSPAFTKATEAVNQAVKQAESARQALRTAEHSPATSPQELGKLIQADSRAQQALQSATFGLRVISSFPIDLRSVPPKPTKSQP